jgi:hypothetical protein
MKQPRLAKGVRAVRDTDPLIAVCSYIFMCSQVSPEKNDDDEEDDKGGEFKEIGKDPDYEESKNDDKMDADSD